jgi:hypothetical protein
MINVFVPLEQPIPIRQYTHADRWLAVPVHRLRDQARDVEQGALDGVGDWTQTQKERER